MSKHILAQVALAFSFLLANNSVLANAEFSYMAADGYPGSGIHISGCANNCQADIVIPEELDGFVVTGIGDSAFLDQDISSITLPDSVISIGWEAFANNGINSLNLPSSLQFINEYAFENNQISLLAFPATIESIGFGAFRNNGLSNVTFSDGITTIGQDAFAENLLYGVIIPDSVTNLDWGAFRDNQLTTVEISNSILIIRAATFANNQLPSVTISENINHIESSAFEANALTSIYFNGSRPEIESGAFAANPSLSLIYYCSGTVGWPGEPIEGITPTSMACGHIDGGDGDGDGDGETLPNQFYSAMELQNEFLSQTRPTSIVNGFFEVGTDYTGLDREILWRFPIPSAGLLTGDDLSVEIEIEEKRNPCCREKDLFVGISDGSKVLTYFNRANENNDFLFASENNDRIGSESTLIEFAETNLSNYVLRYDFYNDSLDFTANGNPYSVDLNTYALDTSVPLSLVIAGSEGNESFSIKSINISYPESTQSPPEESGFIYIPLENGIEITAYQGIPPLDLLIPQEIDGQTVIRIGYSAFSDVPLNSITFPSTITSIADWAFENSGLQTIFFNGERPEIASTAFWNNPIENIRYCYIGLGWPGEPISGVTPELDAACEDIPINNMTWDFDANGSVGALSDGLLFLRYVFGVRGDDLTKGVIRTDSPLTPTEVESNLEDVLIYADIDGNGDIDALTDGLLLLRYMFTLRGNKLSKDIVTPNATRTSAADIEAYIESRMP
jgi:hypothetical protein